jgi:EAL domain-containing protein (putative c-di-GMP-specific phosphodiesterase class I)
VVPSGPGKLKVDLADMDMRNVVRQATSAFALLSHRLDVHLPSHPVPVRCDMVRAVQCLSNLVGNAEKYAPGVTPIRVELVEAGGSARVVVTDEGRGIAAADLERIFERFSRLEDPFTMQTSGSGLGLYIARELARAMGGDITVTSELGEGSAFAFTLPICAGDAAAVGATQSPAAVTDRRIGEARVHTVLVSTTRNPYGDSCVTPWSSTAISCARRPTPCRRCPASTRSARLHRARRDDAGDERDRPARQAPRRRAHGGAAHPHADRGGRRRDDLGRLVGRRELLRAEALRRRPRARLGRETLLAGADEGAVDGFDLAVATRTATRRAASPTIVRQRRDSDTSIPSVSGDVVGSDPLNADLVTELSELYDWGSGSAEPWSAEGDGVRPEELEQALAKGELWVAYQPIVALANEGVVGVEALARWEHPQRGDVSPAEFVPIAERSGLIAPLGAFVLGEAAAQVAEWNVLRTAAGRQPLTLAVNMSPNQVSDPLLCTTLREALDRHGMSPPSLIVELGEPALMRLLAGDQRQVRDLLQLGVSIAFDDFSAAATSLTFLQRFHVDVVKVDRSHVRGLDRDAAGDSTVAAIVSIAHRLNRAVVAEGVESVEQADHLRRLGCEYAQGFLFGYPVPATQIAARVLARDGGDGPQVIEL